MIAATRARPKVAQPNVQVIANLVTYFDINVFATVLAKLEVKLLVKIFAILETKVRRQPQHNDLRFHVQQCPSCALVDRCTCRQPRLPAGTGFDSM